MDLSASAQYWLNLMFLWLGFGTFVGLVARMLLPDGEPKTLFGNLVVGVSGSCAGPMILVILLNPEHFNPIGPLGLFVSILAAVVFLLGYRFFLSWRKTPVKP